MAFRLQTLVALMAAMCLACVALGEDWKMVAADPDDLTPNAPLLQSSEVLILYSYSADKGYTRSQQAGIVHGLGGRFARNLTIYEEHLHADAPLDEQTERAFVALLRQRYASRPLKLVITADTPATRFAARYWRDAFPSVPVIFSAATEVPPEVALDRLPFTGVVESLAVIETLDQIERLFPRTRRVLVTTTRQESMASANQQIKSAFSKRPWLELVWVDGPSLEDQMTVLRQARPEDVVLHAGAAPSSNGQNIMLAAPSIADTCPRPIFALYSAMVEQMGTFAVGGVVASGESYGHRAAAMARRVLRGESVGDIPVVFGANRPMFDERLLERWGIDRSLLPNDALIVNVRPNDWKRYTPWVIGAIVFIAAQSAIIAALMLARRHARKEAIRASQGEERYRELAANVPGVAYSSLYWPDGRRRLEFAGPGLERLLGKEFAQRVREDLDLYFKCISPADHLHLQECAEAAMRNNTTLECDYQLMPPDRPAVWVRSIARCTMLPDGAQRWHGLILDISDHKRTEQARTAVEERLRLASLAGDDVIWDWDLATSRLIWNDALTNSLGYPQDLRDTALDWWVELVHPDDRDRVADSLHRAIEDPAATTWSDEYRFAKADGTYIDVIDRGTIVRDEAGKALRAVGVMFDITLLKNTERQLRQSEQAHRSLVSMAGAVLWRADPRTLSFTFVSEEAERLLGYPKSRWLEPMFWVECIHPDDRGWASRFCLQQVQLGLDHVFEYRMIAADGRTIWLRDDVRVTRNENQEAVELSGVMFDITLRKSAEEALRESESSMRAIADRIPGVVFRSYQHTDGTLERVYTSAGHEELFGVPLGPKTRSMSDDDPRFEPDDTQRYLQAMRTAAVSGDPVDLVLRVRRPDGKRRWVNLRARPTRGPGDSITWDGVLLDITAIKRLETERDQLIDVAPDLICIGSLDGYMRVVNTAWERTLGWTAEELTSRPWLDFVHPDDRNASEDARSEMIAGTMVLSFRNRYRCKDGSYRTLSWNVVPQPENGLTFGCARDVTESERQTRLLEQTNRAARIGGWELDVQAAKLFWSEQVYRIHDLEASGDAPTLEQAIGYYAPESLPLISDAVKAAIEHGAPFDLELQLNTAKGRSIWVHSIGHAERLAGKTLRVWGSFQDITERKSAQRDLALSETRYRLASRATNDVIWDWDLTSNGLTRSDSASTAITTPGAPLGEHPWWRDHLHPDDADRVIAGLKAALGGVATGWGDDYRLRKSDGRYADVSDRGYIVRDSAGRALRMIGAMSDVTRRKAVENRLRESEQRLRQITENAREVFWVTNAEGSEIQYVSPAFRDVWGFDPHVLIERSAAFRDHIHPEDLPAFLEASDQACRRGFDVQYRIIRPDGGVRWIRDRAYPVRDQRGAVYRIAGIAEDVTESRRSQDEIRRTNEVQQLLLGELDHRVKNALAGLLTLIDQSALSAHDVEDFAQSIRTRVSAMASVHSLLSESSWKPLELRRLTTALYPPDAAGTLTLEGPPTPVPARQATALAMVMQELMTNSVKHGAASSPSGRIDVSWTVQEDSGRHRIDLRWRERGGPTPKASPDRRLGSRLIEGFTHFELAGTCELRYGSEGADHHLTFRLDAGSAGERPPAAVVALPVTEPSLLRK